MKGLIIFWFFLFTISHCSSGGKLEDLRSSFNVLEYGADGNGKVDSKTAFQKAWTDFCQSNVESPTLVVPAGSTFLLSNIEFAGPCKSKDPHIQIGGNIVGPPDFHACDGNDCEKWIGFTEVSGLIIDGRGKIDAQGQSWWKACTDNGNACGKRRTALHFNKCNGLRLSYLQLANSQRSHIFIYSCDHVLVSDLQIVAPGQSPNTDGIDVSQSNYVTIQNSDIGTGDDCIAIKGFSSYVNITNVMCGPGHGISIGSLGMDGAYETVEEVHVQNCTFTRTQNGARIKTWKGGKGYARKISFEQIKLIDSGNPIIIDQQYNPNAIAAGSPIQISDVTFRDIYGSSADVVAINLNCGDKAACTNIVINNVNITSGTPGHELKATCHNAQGTANSASPAVPCLSSRPT